MGRFVLEYGAVPGRCKWEQFPIAGEIFGPYLIFGYFLLKSRHPKMIHLILLAYALTVVMGTASAAYVLQARKSLKYDYLRPLYAYTVIFLVSMFGGQILEYVYINILGGSFRDVPPGIMMTWTAFLDVVRVALLYAVGRSFYVMKGPRAIGPFLWGFVLIAGLIRGQE